MSHSSRPLDQVIIYNPYNDTAEWRTPSEARRITSARPWLELITETDVDYKYILEKAGPKPVRIVERTEDYNAEE